MKKKGIYNPLLGDCDEFLAQYRSLVWMVVRRTALRLHVERDDLFQEGMIGLLRCYLTYDPDKGAVTTHAVSNIRGKIFNYIRDKGHTIRPNRRIYDIKGKMLRQELEQKTDSELSLIFDVTLADVAAARGLIINPDAISLNYTLDDKEKLTAEDMVGSVDDFTAVEVEEFIKTLELNEQKVLEMKVKGYVQKDIACEIGFSQMHVSRMIQRIGVKYRRFLGGVEHAVHRD